MATGLALGCHGCGTKGATGIAGENDVTVEADDDGGGGCRKLHAKRDDVTSTRTRDIEALLVTVVRHESPSK